VFRAEIFVLGGVAFSETEAFEKYNAAYKEMRFHNCSCTKIAEVP